MYKGDLACMAPFLGSGQAYCLFSVTMASYKSSLYLLLSIRILPATYLQS